MFAGRFLSPRNRLFLADIRSSPPVPTESLLGLGFIVEVEVPRREPAEAAHLHDVLVPPQESARLCEDPEATLAEYVRMYERKVLKEWRRDASADVLQAWSEDEVADLGPEELERLRLLEDAVSSRLLARERWKVRRKLEALDDEVTGRARRGVALERARVIGGPLRHPLGNHTKVAAARETLARTADGPLTALGRYGPRHSQVPTLAKAWRGARDASKPLRLSTRCAGCRLRTPDAWWRGAGLRNETLAQRGCGAPPKKGRGN